MQFKTRQEVEQIRKEFPEGTLIEIQKVNDPYVDIPRGTRGTVTHVDDIGQIHWTGSGIALIKGEDRFHKVED